MTAVLLKTGSAYGVGSYFIDQLSEGFCKLGVECVVIDLQDPNALARLQVDHVDFVLAINGIALRLQIEGKPLHRWLNAPAIALCIDDPLHLSPLMGENTRDLHVTVVDECLADMMQRRHKSDVAGVHYLPHGACDIEESPEVQTRDIDLLFAGTYEHPDEIRLEWDRFSEATVCRMEEVVATALENRALPFSRIWDQMRGEGNALFELAIEREALPAAEKYARQLGRHQLIAHLIEQGVPLTLAGSGWQNFPLVGQTNYLGQLPFAQLIREFRRTKIALHLTPAFTAGSHERPLTAMLQGAAVVCDRNPFFARNFAHLPLFDSHDWNEAVCQIERLLSDTTLRDQIAAQSQQVVADHHTWTNRAASLLELIQVAG